jgi:2-polyprenyl-3-methyl-5-hydroxy-6-metoxy-1,4-benzoquinol methylase
MFFEKRKENEGVIPIFGNNDFSRRSHEPEIMDDPASPEDDLRITLRQFSFINRFFSRTHALFCRYIFPDIVKTGARQVTIMDIGAGGGDFARWCILFLRRRGIVSRIICLDSDPRAVSYLREACAAFPEIKIECASFLEVDKPACSIDYVLSTHVLHHVSDAQIPRFLGLVYKIARRGIMIVDLERSLAAYCAFSAFSAIVFPKGFTRYDGLLSIRKGFTSEDVRGYIDAARLNGHVKVRASALWHLVIWGTKLHQ